MSLNEENAEVLSRREAIVFAGASTLGVLLFGCGGGSGSSGATPTPSPTPSPTPTPGPVGELGTMLFSRANFFDSNGGEIVDSSRKIKLIVPPGALMKSTEITLDIYEKQRNIAAPNKFKANENAIDIKMDIDSMNDGRFIEVILNFDGEFSEVGTMAFATNIKGDVVPLEIIFDDLKKEIIARINKKAMIALVSGRSRGGSVKIGVFSSAIASQTSNAFGQLYVFDKTKHDFTILDDVSSKKGKKRIALIVHGIMSDRKSMSQLALFLDNSFSTPLDLSLKDNSEPVYQEVWCYEYNWKARIEESAKLLADKLKLISNDIPNIDIFAHSMGGLVCRWALEHEGLGGTIRRLITLSTPHDGVPLQVIQFLLWLLANKTGVDVAGYIPGVNDLVSKSIENPLSPSFLKKLNNDNSKFKDKADYYTLAGVFYDDYIFGDFNMGKTINDYYYNAGDLSDTIRHDGIVPQYSSIYDGLSRKSDSWLENIINRSWTVTLNHHDVAGASDDKLLKLVEVIRPWIISGFKSISVGVQ